MRNTVRYHPQNRRRIPRLVHGFEDRISVKGNDGDKGLVKFDLGEVIPIDPVELPKNLVSKAGGHPNYPRFQAERFKAIMNALKCCTGSNWNKDGIGIYSQRYFLRYLSIARLAYLGMASGVGVIETFFQQRMSCSPGRPSHMARELGLSLHRTLASPQSA